MKLITVFGLVSALLLLSVSTILVVKQNRSDDLASEDFECLKVTYDYDRQYYLPHLVYFSNTCEQKKKFTIAIDDNSVHYRVVTDCLSHNQKYLKNIHKNTTTILSVKSRNC